MNKLAKYYNPKDMAASQRAKKDLYEESITHDAFAYKPDGQTVPLSSKNLEDVDFTGGLWRVQQPFPHEITTIIRYDGEENPKQFVLGVQIPKQEANRFKYYNAEMVIENGWGKFMGNYNIIVGKYEADAEIYMAYGKTIEAVRAFLAVRLFDLCQDEIHQKLSAGRMAKEKK
ncbi:MAG: hypothetical protein LBJ73_03360 [Rickettsiales bacterium]|jgi:hypothetical protein|nr:hypothetical protein [Rickettsiales bacterium]